MSADITIGPVRPDELDTVMPLIRGYQEFYGVDDISPEVTRGFFGRFTEGPEADRERGWLYAAWEGERPAGFACYYRVHASLLAADSLLLHDLYVVDEPRGAGIGRSLIDTGVNLAREQGLAVVEWSTAPDNHRAQRLYDSTGAEPSSWIIYELEVKPRS